MLILIKMPGVAGAIFDNVKLSEHFGRYSQDFYWSHREQVVLYQIDVSKFKYIMVHAGRDQNVK